MFYCLFFLTNVFFSNGGIFVPSDELGETNGTSTRGIPTSHFRNNDNSRATRTETICQAERHSTRMRTARLQTVPGSVATRCQY